MTVRRRSSVLCVGLFCVAPILATRQVPALDPKHYPWQQWNEKTDVSKVFHPATGKEVYRARRLAIDSESLKSILKPGNTISFPLSEVGTNDGYDTVCSFLLDANPVVPQGLLDAVPGLVSLTGAALTRDEEHICYQASLTVTWSETLGFFGQILTTRGPWYAEPIDTTKTKTPVQQNGIKDIEFHMFKHSDSTHVKEQVGMEAYKDEKSGTTNSQWHCDSFDNDESTHRRLENEVITKYVPGQYYIPRTYRIAILASVSYVDALGGGKGNALEGIINTITRVSSIYKQDLGVELRMIEGQDKLVQVGTQPLVEIDDEEIIIDNTVQVTDVTNIITAIVGVDQYDVGHMFTTGNGGAAEVGVVCNDRRKAHGVSGGPNATGSAFQVDYVAHEVGHQFGARHTFAGIDRFCGENINFVSKSAVEPGSGSTIMGYAGICGADDLQANTDPYFHIMSIVQVANFLSTLPETCGGYVLDPDHDPLDPPPLDSAVRKERPRIGLTQRIFRVPFSTAFELSLTEPASATLYNWEQIDAATAPFSIIDGPDGGNGTETVTGPRFRSYLPTSAGYKRMFPSLELLLLRGVNGKLSADDAEKNLSVEGGDIVSEFEITAKAASLVERLPISSPASMLFAASARVPLGGFSFATMRVVVESVGPLEITHPKRKGTEFAHRGLIEWNSNGAETLASEVEAYVSVDDGKTFPYFVGTGTMASGKLIVEIPDSLCGNGKSLLTTYPKSRVLLSSRPENGNRFLAVTSNRVVLSCNPKPASVGLLLFLSIVGVGVLGATGILVHRGYVIQKATIAQRAETTTASGVALATPSTPRTRLGDEDNATVWSEPNTMFTPTAQGTTAATSKQRGKSTVQSIRNALGVKTAAMRRGPRS